MELFAKLFPSLLVFVYHCFDRIVIHGYLSGHSFMEQELNRLKVAFRKNDNAFLAVDDPEALQAAADRLSPPIIRLREVLLHGGNRIGGWTAKQIHQTILTAFRLTESHYGLNQLRYDLRSVAVSGRIMSHP